MGRGHRGIRHRNRCRGAGLGYRHGEQAYAPPGPVPGESCGNGRVRLSARYGEASPARWQPSTPAPSWKKQRIAFISHRYGPEVNGGAESSCRMFAERMARYHQVEVLTTRAWTTLPGATNTRRHNFPQRRHCAEVPSRAGSGPRAIRSSVPPSVSGGPRPRRRAALDPGAGAVCARLTAIPEKNRTAYDLFLFQTYLYYTTCCGLPIVADRAILIPTAHDELPIYLSLFDALFREVRCLLCLTPEELAFLRRRFFDLEPQGGSSGSRLGSPATACAGSSLGSTARRHRRLPFRALRRAHR